MHPLLQLYRNIAPNRWHLSQLSHPCPWISNVCDALIQAYSIQSWCSPHTLRIAEPMFACRQCNHVLHRWDLYACLQQIGAHNLCIYIAAYLLCGHSSPHLRRSRTRNLLLIWVVLNGTNLLNTSLLHDFYPTFLQLSINRMLKSNPQIKKNSKIKVFH